MRSPLVANQKSPPPGVESAHGGLLETLLGSLTGYSEALADQDPGVAALAGTVHCSGQRLLGNAQFGGDPG